MKREMDLMEYLPMYMRKYREVGAALEAQEPEFVLAWKAAERTLYNEFIETADEAGISRFEGILGIVPAKDEALELRRNRVWSLWFSRIPYTFRFFLERLIALCGESNLTVTKHFLSYRIDIQTTLEAPGQARELDRLIEMMMPCNMVVLSHNRIFAKSEGGAYAAGCVGSVEHFVVSSLEQRMDWSVNGTACAAGGIRCEERFVISSEE